jgi:DNA-binding PadR family transcriptional regulator
VPADQLLPGLRVTTLARRLCGHPPTEVERSSINRALRRLEAEGLVVVHRPPRGSLFGGRRVQATQPAKE